MYKKNRYLDELGIPRRIYSGNFVRERKVYRLSQRYRYGFDYRDIFNVDAHFEYKTKHPMIGKLICKFNSAIRLYLDEYDYPEDDGNQIVEDYIRASQLLLEIMGYCWM